jgi:N-acetylglucosamine-6-phosphate deacetylase
LLLFAYRMIGPRRLFLVTDSSRAVDMPVGKYKIGNCRTGNDITHDGRVSRTSTGLGSSSMGMDHMLRVMQASTGAPLWEIIRMASLTPAERLGIDREVGSLKAGKRSDLVLLTKTLRVKKVWLGENAPL